MKNRLIIKDNFLVALVFFPGMAHMYNVYISYLAPPSSPGNIALGAGISSGNSLL